MKLIDDFGEDNYFLSNFYPSPIKYKGITYQTAEAAFQAQKDPSRQKEFINLNPALSKKLGRSVKLRKDWELVKDNIMYEIVYAKFVQNPLLLKKLINTGDAFLIEGNTWYDTYWGVCNGEGKNKLGKILMKIRSELNAINK